MDYGALRENACIPMSCARYKRFYNGEARQLNSYRSLSFGAGTHPDAGAVLAPHPVGRGESSSWMNLREFLLFRELDRQKSDVHLTRGISLPVDAARFHCLKITKLGVHQTLGDREDHGRGDTKHQRSIGRFQRTQKFPRW